MARASLGSSACGSTEEVDPQHEMKAGYSFPSKYPQKRNCFEFVHALPQ